MLYANYNTTHTFNRSAAKSQKPSETKAKQKQQKPKAKSQESSEAKAKSQMGMQIGSKLQQIARKSEILAPKCSKYKPEARNRRSQKPKAKSQMGMQIGSKLQQIARKSEMFAPKCSKYKKPEARNRRSQKPKARSHKKCQKKNAPPKKLAKFVTVPQSCFFKNANRFCCDLVFLKEFTYSTASENIWCGRLSSRSDQNTLSW